MHSAVNRCPGIYRSTRPPQQLKFPGRRKVVKPNGCRRKARSPRQSTLTQAGYVMQLPAETLDLCEWEADPSSEHDEPDPGCLADVMKESTAIQAILSSEKSGTGTTKRLIIRPDSSNDMLRSSLTNQLPSNLSKIEVSHGGQEHASTIGGHETIVRGSDRDSRQAPVKHVGLSHTHEPTKGLAVSMLPGTSTDDLNSEVNLNTATTMSTPKRSRNEIPSSQPSPFTPISLLGRHSQSSCLESSPTAVEGAIFASKGNNLIATHGTPSGMQGGLSGRALFPLSEQELKYKQASLGVDFDTDTILRACINSEGGLAIGSDVSQRRTMLQAAKRPRLTAPAQEIPDSDEDELSASAYSPRASRTARQRKFVALAHPTVSTCSSVRRRSLRTSQKREGSPLPPFHDDMGFARPGDSAAVAKPMSSAGPLREVPSIPSHTKLPNSGEGSSDNAQKSQPITPHYPFEETLESQRVPLDNIHALGPQTDRSDIIISIHPEYVQLIVDGTKNHEFRNYKIPQTVTRFWIYTTRPVCELQYLAVIAPGFRLRGEIDSSTGVGNAEFNAGQMAAKYAYRLVQVYQLNNPISLSTMKKNGWIDGPPQRYTYVPPAVVGSLLANLRCALVGENWGCSSGHALGGAEDIDSNKDTVSVSQEVEAQLHNDMSTGRNLRDNSYQPHQAIQSVSTNELATESAEWVNGTLLYTGEGHSVKRPKLDFGASCLLAAESANSEKQELDALPRAAAPCVGLSPQPQDTVRQLKRLQEQSMQTQFYSIGSTQVVLPDSLFDEIRQAPQAVVLDSEDSDAE